MPVPVGVYGTSTAAELVDRSEYERLFSVDTVYADAGFSLTTLRLSARDRAAAVDLRVHVSGNDRAGRQQDPIATRDVIWFEIGLDAVPTRCFRRSVCSQDRSKGPRSWSSRARRSCSGTASPHRTWSDNISVKCGRAARQPPVRAASTTRPSERGAFRRDMPEGASD